MTRNKRKKKNVDGLAASFNKLRQLFNRREKIGFGVLLLAMIGAAALEAISIGAIPVFISLAMDPENILQHETVEPALTYLGITTARSLIIVGCATMLLIYLIKTIYNCLLIYFKARYTQNRQLKLTHRLFQAYMNAPYEFHLGRNTAELLRNTQKEVMTIVTGVLTPFLNLVLHVLMTLGIVALLLLSEPLMALVAITLMGVAGFGYQYRVRQKIKAYGQEAQHHRTLNMKAVQQGLGSLKEARILRRENFFVESLRRSLHRMMIAERYNKVISGITTPYMEFVAVGGLLTITILLVVMGRDMQIIAPTLALFAAALVRLRSGVGGIVGSVTELRYKVVSIDPVFDDLKLLDFPSSPYRSLKHADTPPDPAEPAHVNDLALTNIWYRYPGASDYSLKDVTLTIPRGQAVAFVGPTGAGKTTIVDVILGLLKPERGEIRVDGRDIQHDLATWQRHVGYIPQFIYLTDDTIRRNIALGLDDKDIDEDRITQAVAAAQLTELVDRLPGKLDTIVGERGVRLSGGQRQRIGIARALYQNPDVLVMDEATSALDNATEKSVIEAVNKLKGTRTIIMIAHRLSTVSECDVLYCMKDGQIETSGSYAEIVDKNATLRAMAG
ncbi:MAG: ABC transporter ATP-binding protein [Phycisphaeraceae bacterium]